MNNKYKRGAGNTTLNGRINALPYANKIDELNTSSCYCLKSESSVECLKRIDDGGCCRKLNIHSCSFDKNYPIFIYVPGLGCGYLSKKEQIDYNKMYLNILNTYSIENGKKKFPDKNFLFVCHKSKVALQTIKDISLSGCKKDLFSKSNFIPDFCSFLEEQLSKGHTIYLYGESFGGSICNVISERVNNQKLFIRTFGSIYISNKSKIPKNIKNHMFSGDVAWRKLSGKCPDAENNIERVDTQIKKKKKLLIDKWGESEESNTYYSYYNFLGSSDEWALHTGYYYNI